MAKYMAFWEVDTSRIPEDPKAKKNLELGFQELIAKQLKGGIIKDWGAFAGEWCGYVIFEGSAVELHTLVSMWVPFAKFKTREVITINEVIKSFKALPG
jgi:muconolactone delta-isomerase